MAKVIKVENISKAYQLGEFGTGTIANDLKRFWARTRGKEDPFLKIGETNDRTKKGDSNIVWSLKDINFEVEQGDAVGIIGRNGAGKSTLLKILSRVTAPTTGSVKVKGRIASLLEVGTGFHPELTGKENIYLNGTILGMRKAEIKRKFDEIVDFAGVERYIDTPVKRYSSGMYVRLAFAVAAHLESEILIVDEVLAVGDAEFQKKCLGKMGEVSRGEGRTILFVSHNMGMINQLCNKSILLANGLILNYDLTSNIQKAYLSLMNEENTSSYYKKTNDSSKTAEFIEIQLLSSSIIDYSEPIVIKFEGILKEFFPGMLIGIGIQDQNLVRVTTFIHEIKYTDLTNNRFKGILTIPKCTLAPNFYSFVLALWNKSTAIYDLVEKTCDFQIKDNGTELALYEGLNNGYMIVDGKWQLNNEIA
ncbi:MAG: transporter related protein [Mucilaginibacter sp.]|nr:transporter related protein [Mucilaginibacter sp.]